MEQLHNEKRDKTISLKVSKSEKELIKRKADQTGRTMNQYLRDCVLSDPIFTELQGLNEKHIQAMKQILISLKEDMTRDKITLFKGMNEIKEEIRDIFLG